MGLSLHGLGSLAFALALLGSAASAQPPAGEPPGSATGGPTRIFAEKGCARCHRVGSLAGGGAASDLARLRSGTGVFDIGAAMWNHVARMRAGMRQQLPEWPHFTPQQLSDVMAFLFTAQSRDVPGNVVSGARLYVSRGCAACHGSGQPGDRAGPALEALAEVMSPVRAVAVMWNHGSQLGTTNDAPRAARSMLTGAELADIMAYIDAAAQGGVSAPVVVGVAERGRRRFAEQGCGGCHGAEGKPSELRPGLGPGRARRTVTDLAARMWKHGAALGAATPRPGASQPRLTPQDGADLVAYLHASHHFDTVEGDARQGSQLVHDKGCLACHAIYGRGGDVAPDLATANVVGSQAGQLAAMWNHGRYMETEAQRRTIVLPALTAQELADITRYLAGLGSLVPSRR